MKKLGFLVVSYGAREASMIGALRRSAHDVDIFVADKQRNPYNVSLATEHRVIPDLSVDHITDFAREYADRIDIALIGPEGPIINGARNRIEAATNGKIKVLAPTQEAAIEGNKILQRELLDSCYPSANPRWKAFYPEHFGNNAGNAKDAVLEWANQFGLRVAVKPAYPTFGKGVGVYKDHFTCFDQLWDKYFVPNFETGPVIIEEQLEGEEFSGQYEIGNIILKHPFSRDHKRAEDGDKGLNTGGTGAYTGSWFSLPFMNIGHDDFEEAERIATNVIHKLTRKFGHPALRGSTFYPAFMATKDGVKVLEFGSRRGDPEGQTLEARRTDDAVDYWVRLAQGREQQPMYLKASAVGLYKMPFGYGGVGVRPAENIADLTRAYHLSDALGDRLHIYPASMRLNPDGTTDVLSSRGVYSIGIADDYNGAEFACIEEARQTAQRGLDAVKGNMWQRHDIATPQSIQKSIDHMKELRGVK